MNRCQNKVFRSLLFDYLTEIFEVSRCNRMFVFGSPVIVELYVVGSSYENERLRTPFHLKDSKNEFQTDYTYRSVTME